MKIAFRNFLTTLRRYKVSSLLNVIGLTLAFTAFYVIMTQVWWELGLEYDNERKLTAIVGLFALLAVVIALMGVFGLVLFETQHRRREIAVRRVMGASRGEILAMFNRRYVMLVAVCFVLAVPVSIWAVRHWLAGFAYAVPLYWWVFALALAGVLAVTALTVTVRSWRAVNENPAESVKSE